MSKKRRNQLKRGRFYASYPNGGHPALIYKKNKRKNRYDAVVFGTSPGKHRTYLVIPIGDGIKVSVVHNRPIRGTRKDYGDKELTRLKVSKIDKPKIMIIKRKITQETRRYKEYKEKIQKRNIGIKKTTIK